MFNILILAAAAALQSPAPAASVSIENAWVRLPAVSGRPAAGYFTLVGGRADDQVESVASPNAKRVELHETTMSGGVMKMAPLADVTIPAGARIPFKPGGNHAMLFGFDAGLKPGGEVPLTFTFKSGAKVSVKARLVAPGEGPTAGHHH